MCINRFITGVFSLFFVLLFLGCGSSDDIQYEPFFSDNKANVVLWTLQDEEGRTIDCNRLLSQNAFSVYGCQSRKFISVNTFKPNKDKAEICLRFNAELPDKKNVRLSQDNQFYVGNAAMKLCIDGQSVQIGFHFSFPNRYDDRVYPFLADSVSYNNTTFLVKRTSNFVFLTLRKNVEGGFDVVKQ